MTKPGTEGKKRYSGGVLPNVPNVLKTLDWYILKKKKCTGKPSYTKKPGRPQSSSSRMLLRM